MTIKTVLFIKMSYYATVVVNLCAPRTHPPYFTFNPIRKLVLNYTTLNYARYINTPFNVYE
jgi:hypothetical protein